MFLQEHRKWKLMVAILALIGLGMYIIFGCGAGLFSNIYLVPVCRALVGVVSIIPVALWMPNERIIEAGQQKKSTGVFRNYYPFIVGMFFLMVIFFNYPANFAMESSRLGTVSESACRISSRRHRQKPEEMRRPPSFRRFPWNCTSPGSPHRPL